MALLIIISGSRSGDLDEGTLREQGEGGGQDGEPEPVELSGIPSSATVNSASLDWIYPAYGAAWRRR
jgi:hypothetical protein